MKRYIEQLLADIADATEHIPKPYEDSEADIWDWKTEEEERQSAKTQTIEEWTGIRQVALPAQELLTDEQIETLYEALKKMLDAYNMSAVFMLELPQRVKYEVIRTNFAQEQPMLRWHMAFFDVCTGKDQRDACLMGDRCQCRFFEEMHAGLIDEDLTPEEERQQELEWEIRRLKKKYGSRWMKYYPYHLDPDYDDEHGNPYDYGFGEDDDEDDDQWWRR